MRRLGDKAIRKFIKEYTWSAARVVRYIGCSENTLRLHPDYKAALVKRAELKRNNKGELL